MVIVPVICAVLAVALAVASVLAAHAHGARVGRVLAALADLRPGRLRALPGERRLDHIATRAQPGEWLALLAGELRTEATSRGRVLLIDEALADVERRLDASAAWPSAAIRVAAFGGLGLGLAAYLTGSGAMAIVASCSGLLGAALAAAARARAVERARACRASIDELFDALADTSTADPEGEPGSGDLPATGRPSARSRRRRPRRRDAAKS